MGGPGDLLLRNGAGPGTGFGGAESAEHQNTEDEIFSEMPAFPERRMHYVYLHRGESREKEKKERTDY